MQVAYIAGPYRASSEFGIHLNIERAGEVALEFWRKGYAVICPHKNSAMFGGAHGMPDEVWLQGDLELLRRSDVVVFTPGWKTSVGAMAEYELAVQLGKTILIHEG